MTNCVILSTQRSGSTLLVDHLSSAPGFLIHSELFQKLRPDLAASSTAPRHYRISYQMHRDSSIARRLAHRFARKRLIGRYLADIYAPKPGIRVIGMKLMYDQTRRYPEVVDWLRRHDVRFVHLVRQNLLKMVVSRRLAQVRGTHSMLQPLPAATVELEVSQLTAELERIQDDIDRHRSLCQSLKSCEVTYEAFVTDRERETGRILELLGGPDHRPAGSRLHKTNPYELRNVISNYDEVARALAANPRFRQYVV